MITLFACQNEKLRQFGLLEKEYASLRAEGEIARCISVRRKIQKLDPNEVAHLDTLASLYFGIDSFQQAFALADSAIDIIPSERTLEIGWKSAMKVKNYYKGIEFINKGFEIDLKRNEETMFALAWFQFHSRKYADCIATIDWILGVPEYRFSVKPEVFIIENQTQTKILPLWAICYNMKGACNYQLGELEKAKDNFISAVNLYPEYSIAQENLAVLQD